ncbi:hypothetical protein NYE69_27105 [Paenibacillus sp. FSL R5-0527]|uniref:hypothetical protein n=1 Tax=Paenibacillus sp. FSL R5-0527 TaxID=2975321 RepID=UPI00097ACAC8|nr:hypothetical protein BK140_22380 [Paenibacillus macerans]
MIESFDDFINRVVEFKERKLIGLNSPSGEELTYATLTYFPFKEDLFCSRCGGFRKNEIEPLYVNGDFSSSFLENFQKPNGNNFYGVYSKESIFQILRVKISPSFWKCQCLQCDSISHIIIHSGPNGEELLILPSTFGGLSTPNTPQNVAFYLDQANRSHIMGANSAAMAMYRAAIEHILVGHGYNRRMLGNKIQDLLKDIEENNAPQWAYEFDTDFLKYIKKLGDSAIHANDGNIEQQIHLDNELIKNVKSVISFLLFVIYESAHKKQQLLDNLKSTTQRIEQ